jgi:hypothetical protein
LSVVALAGLRCVVEWLLWGRFAAGFFGGFFFLETSRDCFVGGCACGAALRGGVVVVGTLCRWVRWWLRLRGNVS